MTGHVLCEIFSVLECPELKTHVRHLYQYNTDITHQIGCVPEEVRQDHVRFSKSANEAAN